MKFRSGFVQITVLLTLLVTLAVTAPARAAGTCYVAGNATGANDGTDWANAYTSLQSALADSCTEIWVAAGTYKPHASNRSVSFMMENNTAIYGGFAGTETMLSERNPAVNVTTLSGDLNGDDSGLNDGLNTFSENSYHVVTSSSLSSSAMLDGFTITGGNANSFTGSEYAGGGIYNDNSSPTLTNLILSNNYAAATGGGMYIYYVGAPTLTNVTFIGNSTSSNGGGLYISTSSPILTNVSFIDNHAFYYGGGIYSFYLGPVLTNVTFSGNTATNGGGFYNMSNSGYNAILTNVTFSGNTASTSGGGLYKNSTYSGTVQLNNVIIANNTGGDCVLESGTLDGASSNNLIEDTGSNACNLSNGDNGNIVGSDPNLGSLVGSPAFIALQSGSPAIDAGTTCTATDQRGASRPQGNACDIGAVETLVVSNTNDSGTGSLRQAIATASGGESITFDASLSGQTIPITSGTLLILKNMTIDGSALASQVTIDGNDNWRVFAVGGGVTAALKNLIVTGGWYNADGGAGLVNNGTLTITNSIFSYHTADNQFGGAILNNNTGNLTIIGSTFSNNSAFGGGAIANYNQLTVKNSTFINNGGGSTDSGGAIYTDGDPGVPLTQITNSTFSGNTANTGGALWSSRTQTITNSTFSGNVANNPNSGGAVWQDSETLNYANNIIANSTNGDCRVLSTIGTNINNLVEDGSCAASLSGDPNLDTLANNGGPTQTFALLPGSPAINKGDDDICDDNPGPNNLDQRGIARPNGDHCDLGAYEHVDTGAPNVTAFNATDATSLNVPITSFTASDDGIITGYLITESATPPLIGNPNWLTTAPVSYTVANAGSHTLYPWAKDGAGNVSAVYGSPDTVNVCFPAITVTNTNDSGAGSLRQAISDACADGTINFNAGLSATTIDLASTLNIAKDLTIDGSALASKITLDGNDMVRVFHITGGSLTTVTLDSLIVTKGYTGTSDGGGLRNEGILTITNSTFDDNSAFIGGGAISSYDTLTITDSTFSNNGGFNGGAIINHDTLTIKDSTFSNNTSALGFTNTGGAIHNAGPATITNSSFSGNTSYKGGGIFTTHPLTITNSTISGNTATITGGLHIESDTTNLANTIIANNSASSVSANDDCTNNAIIGTNINSLIEDGTCSPALSGDPMLGALASNGGPTQTLALLPGSKAINAGNNVACLASEVNDLDQRGMTRSGNGPICDIGAYEYQDSTAPTVVSSLRTGANPTNKASVNFLVTFSEAVTGVSTADFSLTTTGGVSGASISSVTGSGATRTVSLNTGSGNGTIRLNVPASATVIDTAGNALSGLPYTSGQAYIIHKTLTVTSTATQDGWLLETSETSGLGGTLNSSATTFNLGDDAAKKQYLGILSFNTSNMPDTAIITAVTLKVKKSAVVGGGNPVSIFQGFFADVKTGFFGTTSALQTADFQAASSKTVGPTSPTPSANWYTINLTNAKTFVNKLNSNGGVTQVRLRFKLDDNGNAVANYLSLFSGNATNAADRPQLVITYYVP